MNLYLAAICVAACLLGRLLAESRYVEDYPRTASKKGLQVEMVDDALALGIKHAAINVNLSQVVDPTGKSGGPVWKSGDAEFHFRKAALERLDRQIKSLSEQGVVVNLIILAYSSGNDDVNRLLLHPEYNSAAPNKLGAFNCETTAGRQWFVATMEFLAERWSRLDRKYGRAVGFIIGNEVNSHWWWSNRGKVDFEEFAADYLRSVRLAHDAIRRQSSCARVYVSLDHHWGIRYPAGNEQQCFAGKRLIDYFAANAKGLDWHLAFHPYPENLFDPRFWKDKTATNNPEAKRITFKNLQVLTDYLERDELRFQGKPRRVILSEQGFHSAAGVEGERLQAAAYCYAYRKVANLDGIDSFILHRHVDHPHEGGLHLGLRRREGDKPKKLIYECFQKADEDDWREAFEFALPIVGLTQWPLASSVRYIENQFVRLGVDMQAGGAIGYFALRSDQRNLLNNYDRGRFIQQSYYGDEDDSRWNGKPWRWNPVQGGDWRGNSAVILKSKFEADSLKVTTRPRHWASGQLIEDAEMTMRIRLDGPIAHIEYGFRYAGDRSHNSQDQELPALFVDSALKHLVFHKGDSLWAKQPVHRIVPGWPNEYHQVGEPWCAYVDDDDWGVGVYSDRMKRMTCYRHKGDGKTGPAAPPVLMLPRLSRCRSRPDLNSSTALPLRLESLMKCGVVFIGYMIQHLKNSRMLLLKLVAESAVSYCNCLAFLCHSGPVRGITAS